MKKKLFLKGLVALSLTVMALVNFVFIVSAEVGPKIDENQSAIIKAAYLRYIAKFTTWPAQRFENEGSPIVICIVGEDPYGVRQNLLEITHMKELLAEGRLPEIRRLTYIPPSKGKSENPEKARDHITFIKNLRACHMLFLTSSKEGQWSELRRIIDDFPIMMVSEIEGFSTSGGMIEFVVAHRKGSLGDKGIDIHINLEATEKAMLQISSKLLRIKQGVKIVKYPK